MVPGFWNRICHQVDVAWRSSSSALETITSSQRSQNLLVLANKPSSCLICSYLPKQAANPIKRRSNSRYNLNSCCEFPDGPLKSTVKLDFFSAKISPRPEVFWIIGSVLEKTRCAIVHSSLKFNASARCR